MPRLFIAFPLTENAVDSLTDISKSLQQQIQSVKWVNPENIHLTLKFLGETDSSLIPDIKRIIDESVAHHKPINLNLNKLSVFPNQEKPKVIWIGSTDSLDNATAVAIDLDQALGEMGIDREKKRFKPHLTLGRIKQGKAIRNIDSIFERVNLTPIEFMLDRVVLYQSTLTPAGPIYEKLHTTMLSAEMFEG